MPNSELQIPQIVELASAFYGSATLFAALDLGLFAAVESAASAGSPPDAAALATALKSDVRTTTLLADACVSLGLLRKDAEARYTNTDAGRLALVPGAPADLGKAIAYNRDVYGAWGKLAQLVRTGAPVEPPALHLGDDAERTRRFALSMRGRAFAIGRGVVPMVNLAGKKRLLDLAGGPGAWAELFAKTNPELSIVTVDVPAISAVAKECVAEAGLADRIECRPGDYHTDTWERGAYDACTLFGCLHQESPDQIRSIFQRVHDALAPGGTLYVLDMMTDATHTAPRFSALFGLNMALTTENGWVFSDEDLRTWLREAGFEPGPTTPVPPPMPHWLVTATRV